MKVKKDYGNVICYWLNEPYWHKGMWFDTCLKLSLKKKQLKLNL